MHALVMSTTSAHLDRRFSTPAAFTGAVVGAALIGSLGSLDIASIAHSAGVSPDFRALHPATFIGLIVIVVLVGATGWQLIRRRAPDPASLLYRLLPVVVVLSFVADVLLHVVGVAHATWTAVAALMAMDMFVALAALTSYSWLLPVARAPGAASGIA